MKKQFNKVTGLVLVFVVTIVLNGISFAASNDGTNSSAKNAPARMLSAKVRPTIKALSAAVAAPNRRAYYIAKDFGFAISDCKAIDIDEDSLDYTIVDLVYLIDHLEGQPEAAQLQSILKDVIHGDEYGVVMAEKIESISKAYVARLASEQKWYFNVGQTQIFLTYAAWRNDAVAIKTRLKEMQELAKIAPSGTAISILNAVNGLAKYIAKTTLTKEDFTAIVNDAKIITTQVAA